MPDTVTTKPFQSQAQARWAFATGQPWAKRWSRETPGGKGKWFRRLPYKKKSYTLDDLERVALKGDSTPDAIARVAAGVPGLATLKGEQIAPGVTRIRGDLCNVHGKYGSCAEATGGEKPKPKRSATPAQRKPKRKPRAGRAARPKKTDTQRAQEREVARAAERQQNRDAVKQRMADADAGLSPSGFDALMAFAEGTQPTGAMGKGLAEMGLAEQAADGSYRMTPTGRAAVAAADAGDYQRVLDAISRGTDTAGRRQQRTQAQATRRAEQERKRQETERRRAEREAERNQKRTSSGGGKRTEDTKRVPRPKRTPRSSGGTSPGGSRGGGNRGPSKPKIPPMSKLPKVTVSAEERQQQNRANVRQRMAETDTGLSPSGFDTVMAFADGQQPDPARGDELVTMGLAEKNEDGTYRMTTAARTVVEAANAGDYQRAVDAIARAGEAVSKRSTKALKARRVLRATVSGRGGSGNPANLSYPLLQSHVAQAPSQTGVARTQSIPSFAIFKDRTGRLRWIARSTTAYRDRDDEILSIAALVKDADRMTRTAQYGPLRYWHVGQPDARLADAPWGPGLDVGMCDFSTVIGRTAVESGTFFDEAVGKAMQATAPDYELSPGFFHPYGEAGPSDGVYQDIRRFERSLVPRQYARASNYFTGLMVKEQRMNPEEIARRVAAFKADMDAKGVGADAIEAALAGIAQTEKSADEQHAVFKSSGLPVYTAPDGTQGVIQGGQFVALKAIEPPLAEEKAPEVAVEVEPPADEEMGESEEDGITLSPADFDALRGIIREEIMGAVGTLSDAVTKVDNDMKALGYTRQKEADDRATEIATLKAAIERGDKERAEQAARLAELEGEQPIATKGYRASQDPKTVREKEGTGGDGTPPAQPVANPFADMQEFIMGLGANGTQPGN